VLKKAGVWMWPALSAALVGGVVLLWSTARADERELAEEMARYRQRMIDEHEQETQPAAGNLARSDQDEKLIQLAGSQAEETRRAALLVQTDAEQQPTPSAVFAQVPDPKDARQVLAERLRKIEQTAFEPRVVNQYRRVVEKAQEYIDEFDRPNEVELSLAECIRRALEHNYSIRIESFTPAISQTGLVEAEAAFDAVFFLDWTNSKQDRQTGTQLLSSQSDFGSAQGGIRKLFPTGMQAQVSLSQSRTFSNFQFQTVNPSYETKFTASFTQPLLRGFGLDYNRAAINIARTDTRIGREVFIQQVRDQLLAVEQAYWQLVMARRNVMILIETTAQNWVTFKSMEERLEHDATPVEWNNSKSQWQSRVVEFIEAVKNVRDAEDRLKNLLNDPDLPLSRDIEIIPTDEPLVTPIAVDQFAEVRTALDKRSEIRQARLAIEKARIQTQRAKNETLPKLDLTFQYDVQGLSINGGGSFDEMTTNRYRSYSVSVQFSYPLGNRAPQARYRRARLQEHRALVQLRRVIDAVVEEVNGAVRQMSVRYRQIAPQFSAVMAAEGNLRAFQARVEQVSPNYLQTELQAIEQLANTRRRLLQVLVDYNITIAQLEKAKGTLLEYDNVVITDPLARR